MVDSGAQRARGGGGDGKVSRGGGFYRVHAVQCKSKSQRVKHSDVRVGMQFER